MSSLKSRVGRLERDERSGSGRCLWATTPGEFLEAPTGAVVCHYESKEFDGLAEQRPDVLEIAIRRFGTDLPIAS